LTEDIDLGGAEIDPIKLGRMFDGKDYTIKNAVIKTNPETTNAAGLFVADHSSIKNLKLDCITVIGSNVGDSYVGVLAGSCSGGIDKITITNSKAINGKYTGGVVGYGYTDVTNCVLNNVEVKGGYKVGGIIGHIDSSIGSQKVTGNTLTSCKVDGLGNGVYAGGKNTYIVGNVVGYYNCNGICNNNAITSMTTSATGNIGQTGAGKTVTQS